MLKILSIPIIGEGLVLSKDIQVVQKLYSEGYIAEKRINHFFDTSDLKTVEQILSLPNIPFEDAFLIYVRLDSLDKKSEDNDPIVLKLLRLAADRRRSLLISEFRDKFNEVYNQPHQIQSILQPCFSDNSVDNGEKVELAFHVSKISTLSDQDRDWLLASTERIAENQGDDYSKNVVSHIDLDCWDTRGHLYSPTSIASREPSPVQMPISKSSVSSAVKATEDKHRVTPVVTSNRVVFEAGIPPLGRGVGHVQEAKRGGIDVEVVGVVEPEILEAGPPLKKTPSYSLKEMLDAMAIPAALAERMIEEAMPLLGDRSGQPLFETIIDVLNNLTEDTRNRFFDALSQNSTDSLTLPGLLAASIPENDLPVERIKLVLESKDVKQPIKDALLSIEFLLKFLSDPHVTDSDKMNYVNSTKYPDAKHRLVALNQVPEASAICIIDYLKNTYWNLGLDVGITLDSVVEHLFAGLENITQLKGVTLQSFIQDRISAKEERMAFRQQAEDESFAQLLEAASSKSPSPVSSNSSNSKSLSPGLLDSSTSKFSTGKTSYDLKPLTDKDRSPFEQAKTISGMLQLEPEQISELIQQFPYLNNNLLPAIFIHLGEEELQSLKEYLPSEDFTHDGLKTQLEIELGSRKLKKELLDPTQFKARLDAVKGLDELEGPSRFLRYISVEELTALGSPAREEVEDTVQNRTRAINRVNTEVKAQSPDTIAQTIMVALETIEISPYDLKQIFLKQWPVLETRVEILKCLFERGLSLGFVEPCLSAPDDLVSQAAIKIQALARGKQGRKIATARKAAVNDKEKLTGSALKIAKILLKNVREKRYLKGLLEGKDPSPPSSVTMADVVKEVLEEQRDREAETQFPTLASVSPRVGGGSQFSSKDEKESDALLSGRLNPAVDSKSVEVFFQSATGDTESERLASVFDEWSKSDSSLDEHVLPDTMADIQAYIKTSEGVNKLMEIEGLLDRVSELQKRLEATNSKLPTPLLLQPQTEEDLLALVFQAWVSADQGEDIKLPITTINEIFAYLGTNDGMEKMLNDDGLFDRLEALKVIGIQTYLDDILNFRGSEEAFQSKLKDMPSDKKAELGRYWNELKIPKWTQDNFDRIAQLDRLLERSNLLKLPEDSTVLPISDAILGFVDNTTWKEKLGEIQTMICNLMEETLTRSEAHFFIGSLYTEDTPEDIIDYLKSCVIIPEKKEVTPKRLALDAKLGRRPTAQPTGLNLLKELKAKVCQRETLGDKEEVQPTQIGIPTPVAIEVKKLPIERMRALAELGTREAVSSKGTEKVHPKGSLSEVEAQATPFPEYGGEIAQIITYKERNCAEWLSSLFKEKSITLAQVAEVMHRRQDSNTWYRADGSSSPEAHLAKIVQAIVADSPAAAGLLLDEFTKQASPRMTALVLKELHHSQAWSGAKVLQAVREMTLEDAQKIVAYQEGDNTVPIRAIIESAILEKIEAIYTDIVRQNLPQETQSSRISEWMRRYYTLTSNKPGCFNEEVGRLQDQYFPEAREAKFVTPTKVTTDAEVDYTNVNAVVAAITTLYEGRQIHINDTQIDTDVNTHIKRFFRANFANTFAIETFRSSLDTIGLSQICLDQLATSIRHSSSKKAKGKSAERLRYRPTEGNVPDKRVSRKLASGTPPQQDFADSFTQSMPSASAGSGYLNQVRQSFNMNSQQGDRSDAAVVTPTPYQVPSSHFNLLRGQESEPRRRSIEPSAGGYSRTRTAGAPPPLDPTMFKKAPVQQPFGVRQEGGQFHSSGGSFLAGNASHFFHSNGDRASSPFVGLDAIQQQTQSSSALGLQQQPIVQQQDGPSAEQAYKDACTRVQRRDKSLNVYNQQESLLEIINYIDTQQEFPPIKKIEFCYLVLRSNFMIVSERVAANSQESCLTWEETNRLVETATKYVDPLYQEVQSFIVGHGSDFKRRQDYISRCISSLCAVASMPLEGREKAVLAQALGDIKTFKFSFKAGDLSSIDNALELLNPQVVTSRISFTSQAKADAGNRGVTFLATVPAAQSARVDLSRIMRAVIDAISANQDPLGSIEIALVSESALSDKIAFLMGIASRGLNEPSVRTIETWIQGCFQNELDAGVAESLVAINQLLHPNAKAESVGGQRTASVAKIEYEPLVKPNLASFNGNTNPNSITDFMGLPRIFRHNDVVLPFFSGTVANLPANFELHTGGQAVKVRKQQVSSNGSCSIHALFPRSLAEPVLISAPGTREHAMDQAKATVDALARCDIKTAQLISAISVGRLGDFDIQSAGTNKENAVHILGNTLNRPRLSKDNWDKVIKNLTVQNLKSVSEPKEMKQLLQMAAGPGFESSSDEDLITHLSQVFVCKRHREENSRNHDNARLTPEEVELVSHAKIGGSECVPYLSVEDLALIARLHEQHVGILYNLPGQGWKVMYPCEGLDCSQAPVTTFIVHSGGAHFERWTII